MVRIARRMIRKDKARFIITAAGVSVTVMLVLFLFGMYEGVKVGSTSYVLKTPAEIWICQKNSTNLLRSSSFLSSSLQDHIQSVDGVGEVSGIIRVIATARIHDKAVTLFIFGFDTRSTLGPPPTMIQGTSSIGTGEIILDEAFAMKHHLAPGDNISVQDRYFRVSGISRGTNAIVAQFAFMGLEDAQHLLGFPGIVSFYLLTTNGKKETRVVIDSLKRRFSELAVFEKQEFVQNNLEEMETGILPVLWTIAILGMIVGIAVITLMLYGSVLEKREDYALLKALGANQNFLVSLVLRQALLGAATGFVCGVAGDFILAPFLMKLVPEISLSFTVRAVAVVFASSLFIGAIGSWAPIHKLASVYPAEVFRA
ncbi:MAG: FtsX-like permease family protein [Bacteroidota bacterium]